MKYIHCFIIKLYIEYKCFDNTAFITNLIDIQNGFSRKAF